MAIADGNCVSCSCCSIVVNDFSDMEYVDMRDIDLYCRECIENMSKPVVILAGHIEIKKLCDIQLLQHPNEYCFDISCCHCTQTFRIVVHDRIAILCNLNDCNANTKLDCKLHRSHTLRECFPSVLRPFITPNMERASSPFSFQQYQGAISQSFCLEPQIDFWRDDPDYEVMFQFQSEVIVGSYKNCWMNGL